MGDHFDRTRQMSSAEVPKEEEDEVIDEIDVFVNQSLASNLYVLQYPLRSVWNPYPPEASAHFKEKFQHLRLKVPVPKTPEQLQYDRQQHEQGEAARGEEYFSMESSLQPMNATYAIAILNQGQLHLNPLRERTKPATAVKNEEGAEEEWSGPLPPECQGGGILQMRPSFKHMNPVAAGEEAPPEGEPEAEMKKVKVQFQSRKQERIKAWQKNLYANRMKEFEEEPYTPLTYGHPDRSFEPFDKIQHLFFTSENDEGLDAPYTMTRSQYLECLVGDAAQTATRKIPYGVCSRTVRDTLPLVPQVIQLMRSVVIMSYRRIRELISVKCDDAELIAALEKAAVVQDGVWIVRSDYYGEIRENQRLIDTRDLVLSELYKHPAGIFHSDITRVSPVPHADMKALLESFCESEDLPAPAGPVDPLNIPKTRRWTLRVPPDPTFRLEFPEVMERAKAFWEEKDRQLTRLFQKSKTPVLDRFFAEVFAAYGVCNLAFLRKQKKQYAQMGGYENLEQVSDQDFSAKLKKIADELHSAYYLRLHPNEEWNKYRDVIIKVFKEKKGPALTKREITVAAKKYLDAPIPEATYKAIISELAYPSKGTWIFRTGHG